ncbi:hypothetical protein HGRIS_008712 [Hohenbuehelia grisea]|uniref:GST C-terminal domain-containing protein n=1 Tax=Hohenbuehelia grisea TaxID=104357 RepID=A0ABR3J9W2_9AGAR
MSRDVTAQSDVSRMKREADGSWKRSDSTFRNFIEKGGRFEPEKGRYHLYVSYGCPWATRTLIVRKLKGLEEIIPFTSVSPRHSEHGWAFATIDAFPGAEADPLYNSEYVKDLYLRADQDYSGRFTVPVLWDKKHHTIVNNESSEIIRMFNTVFNEILPPEKAKVDLYPEHLRAEIDELNEWVYPKVNNGVYRAGFATNQEPYEKAVLEVFEGLDKLEKLLDQNDYLIGGQLTEADVRTWVTAIRFDVAYVGKFKCNLDTIRSGYPAIHRWMKQLYWHNEAFKASTNFAHIKTGYYWTRTSPDQPRIIPLGPKPDIEPI